MMPQWISDVLELAELLLRLGQRPDVDQVLERLEEDELSLREAVQELRKLH